MLERKTFKDIKEVCEKEVNEDDIRISEAYKGAIHNLYCRTRIEAISLIKYYWEKGETKKGYALFDFFNIQVDELK